MKKAVLVAVLAVAVSSIVLAAPAFAGSPNGQTVTQTQTTHGSFYDPTTTNPCNGDTFNGGQGLLFTGTTLMHVTFFTNSDEGWGTFTQATSFQGTDDGTGVTYSGHATAWGNFNMNEKNQNSEFTQNIHAMGSDGSSITVHETSVFSMNALGVVTVNFDNLSLSCG